MDPTEKEQGHLGGEGEEQVGKPKGELNENEDDKKPVAPGNTKTNERGFRSFRKSKTGCHQ